MQNPANPVLLISLLAFAGPGVAQPPELIPPPRLAEPPLRAEEITGGYKLYLTHSAAERVRKALNKIEDEQGLADTLRGVAKDLNDGEVPLQVEILAHAIAREVPAFKKSLAEKMGDEGVTITVYGLPRKVKDRPVLRAIGKAVLPPDLQEQARALLTMAKTTPLYWKIEPR
jgi:hypothetical protein